MLCDICQTRQAKIFYTEIVNGQKKEQHLCEQCASEHTMVPLNELLGGQGLSSVGSILSGILSSYARDRGKELKDEKHTETRCPECGTTESEFLKTGRTGCPVCYNVFKDMIAKNFKTMQGGMTHTGKEPSYAKYTEIEEYVPSSIRSGSRTPDELKGLDKKLNLKIASDVAKEPDAGSGAKSRKKDETKTDKHVKNTEKSAKKDKVAELKDKLNEALKVEDYDAAARLRDEIRALEVKNEKKKK